MAGSTAPPVDLPCHWLRLDAQGQLLACDDRLHARLGAAHTPDEPEPLTRWLVPASAVLWSSVVLPALRERGQIDEAVLLLDLPEGQVPMAVQLAWAGSGADATITAVLTPATERLRQQGELRQARRSLDTMPGAVLQCQRQPDGTLAFPHASDRLLDLFGVTPTQAARSAQRLLDALAPGDATALDQVLAEAEAHDRRGFRVVLRPRRAPSRAVELQAQWSPADALWQGVLTDVSEREALQHELRTLAQTDALTRLPNRTGLIAHLQACIATRRTFALLFMDCDRFKQVNDSLGHEAGDELLRHLSQRLRHGLRGPDDVVQVGARADSAMLAARLGGDEFVVVADGVADAEAVAALANRLVESLSQPYWLHGLQVVTGVSIGAVLAAPDSTPAQLLRDADTAMYEAKRHHRGRWVLFETAMHERVAASLALETELRHALREGQLRPVFQPIVEIASGRVVGLEALARWRHPVRGDVSPVEFIPVAEESGLIAAVGETVLRLACAAFAGWHELGVGLPPRLSVNLSRAQLTDRGLPQRVAAILQQVGLPASALQLEVTESLAMEDESVRLVLLNLREMGIQLALDDFGTGHSSLASLQRFPVQQIKIDRSFVHEIESSPYHRALVQAALQVAAALNLEAVAEGVETASQARLLAELGCARAQGYLYARPLEAGVLPAYLEQRSHQVEVTAPVAMVALASSSRAHQVIVTGPDGRVLHVNAAFTLNTGYTLADMLGRRPGELLQGPDTDPRAVRMLGDAQTSGSGCLGVEILNYRRDGRPFWVAVDIEPVRDAAGRIMQFVSLQTEITDRKRAEAELAELRQRIDDVRAVGLVGLWERDLISGASRADDNTRRMLGLATPGQTLTWAETLERATPETRPALENYFEQARSGQQRGLFEYSIRHAGGDIVDLQVSWSLRGDRVLGVMIDITGPRRGMVNPGA